MGTNIKPVIRWPLIVGYIGIVALMLACMVGGAGLRSNDVLLRLEDGVVKVQDNTGDWVPVGGESTFELTGKLESTDPWQVAGTTLETRESTQIDEGLEAGDLVKVKGIILEDGTWVAYSIERVEEQTEPTIILIGKVTSVDPWVVNGIKLNVTADTVITGDITPGMIVRVEILLLEDGTWEVISIAPLGEFTEISGCATVVATVVSVNGNKIQFLGWPSAVTLAEDVKIGSNESQKSENEQGEDENDNENNTDNEEQQGQGGILSPKQVVLVVLCNSDGGQVVITQIIIVNIGDGGTSAEGGQKVLICHKPDKKGGHTLSVSASAVPAHLAHGDKLGACP